MFKRSIFRKAPNFKFEVKPLESRSKQSTEPVITCNRTKIVEVLVEPIKSATDKKLYKTIRLENGLTALLISDPISPTDINSESKSAACALCVGVGGYSDPSDIPGLAHFVEHMVFMGTEKYPKENEFSAFISSNGGIDNAATDCESTLFHFDIHERQLPKAMDMLSQIFVSPLMTKDAMQRQREIVESEFAMYLSMDVVRHVQFLASLFPKGHPAHMFARWNLKSLGDDVNDYEKLHKAAHEFKRRHYSANRMTVAVQARMDLAALEQYVVNTFGQIQTNKLPPDDFSPYSFRPDTVTPEFRSMYYIKPVSDITEVHLTWNMRSLISEYESKPHQYVAYLMTHEGKGSLLSYLRKKVWALDLYAGVYPNDIYYTSTHSQFMTYLVLTKDGLDHIDEVLETIFSYINMLTKLGPSERIYKELKKIEEVKFRFSEESDPFNYVQELAKNMQLYPPEHYITADKLFYKYDPKGIADVLQSMRPDKVNIMIMSNEHSTPIRYDAEEKWYGIQYKRQDIPRNLLQRLMEVKPYPQFHLPDENIYVASNFDLVPPAQPYLDMANKLGIDLANSTDNYIYNKVGASKPERIVLKQEDLIATINNFRLDQPNLLRKDRHMELWYKPDFKFRVPTALLYFYFITPLALLSTRDACLLDIWTEVLQLNLKEELYLVKMAAIESSLHVADKGLMFKVNGYSQNVHLLVEVVSRSMNATRGSSPAPSVFEAVREARMRKYHNMLIDPEYLAEDVRMDILLESHMSLRDKASVIRNITIDECREFSNKMLKKMYLQILIQGNLAWHEAITISNKVYANIKWDGFSEDELPKRLIRELPLGEHKLRVRSLNPQSTNSIVTNYYQGETITAKDIATLNVLMVLMKAPLFDTLRTKEQLGYKVFCHHSTSGVLGFSVTVYTQADKFSVSYVDSRIEAFLDKFKRDLYQFNNRMLQENNQSVVLVEHLSDYYLKREVDRNWKEIKRREYQFQRMFTENEAMRKIKLSDVKVWVEKHFSTGNKSHFRKVSIQIMGHNISKNTTVTKSQPNDYALTYMDTHESIGDAIERDTDFIQNIRDFKKTLPIIEVPKVELAQY